MKGFLGWLGGGRRACAVARPAAAAHPPRARPRPPHQIGSFEKFLADRIKVGGKAGALGEVVTVSKEKARVRVSADVAMSKRYLKYLTKKFLKKHGVRDWLRVVAAPKDRKRVGAVDGWGDGAGAGVAVPAARPPAHQPARRRTPF